MIRKAFPALLLITVSAPALADDPRLVEQLYVPDQVVRVEGKPRVQATIAFGDDETIENVAIGDSQAWQVTPNKRANLLFVKPLAVNAVTNMTVVTSMRTYLFDLVASPRGKPVYLLRFTYPEAPPGEDGAQVAQVDTVNRAELDAASDPYAVLDPSMLNFAWGRDGDAALLPAQIYDDGAATYITWPDGAAIPAILVKDFEGTEGPVNFTVRADTIVVEGVPREFVLRSGDDSARLINNGPVRTADAGADRATAGKTEKK